MGEFKGSGSIFYFFVTITNFMQLMVFTRASSLIYVSVMLVITLRIQLNILGGHLFRDVTSISQELQEKYLSLCHNLLDGGIKLISSLVEKQVILYVD